MSCVVAPCDELGSGFEFGHGQLVVDSNLGMGGGSLLAGGLGLDVTVGFYLGGGGMFQRQQWAGR